MQELLDPSCIEKVMVLKTVYKNCGIKIFLLSQNLKFQKVIFKFIW